MKKVIKVWEENKVLLVLAIILLICLIIFGVVAITYFYGSSDNELGNRTDVTKEVPLNKKLLEDIEKELKLNESVKSVHAELAEEPIVYISIKFIDETKMEDAKKIAESAIDLFNEDELAVYDVQFSINTLSSNEVDGYTLWGARNANGSGYVVWQNYNIEKESSESK